MPSPDTRSAPASQEAPEDKGPLDTRRVTTVDGLAIAVHDLGGQGTPLLMAHATGFHGHVFEPMATRMQKGFRCTAFDERGHGDSEVPPGDDFAWGGFALDVLAVLDALDPPGPIPAVGHSAGGAALLLAEQKRPGSFSALYLWEPVMFPGNPPPGRDPTNFLSVGARKRREEFASRAEAFENFSSKAPFDELSVEALHAYVDHGFADLPGGGVRLKCHRDNEALVYEFGSAHDAFLHLSEVACPTALVCGEKTNAFGPVIVKAFAGAMPDATALVLPGLGHFGPLQDPEEVAASALAFFADSGL